MKNSILLELNEYVNNLINDKVLTKENFDDWHHIAFNEDYYIIGYYNCTQWLISHNVDPFEAVQICIEYEIDNFGEWSNRYDNSESTVNMLVYIYGEEVISSAQSNFYKY